MAIRKQTDKAKQKPLSEESRELAVYRGKRSRIGTNEPFGTEHKGSSALQYGKFVVHLHLATRKHYDLRLQLAGVLLSFAVPKGPSLNPEDKRLAIMTENHPLEYLDFEDVIPDGNYGAGPMIVWDSGAVHYLEGGGMAGLEGGKLDFILDGFKLRGRFALIHTGARKKADSQHWLLVKKQDLHATKDDITELFPRSVLSGLLPQELQIRDQRVDELCQRAKGLGAPLGQIDPSRMVPMLCARQGAGLIDNERLYELKLDGVRIVAELRDGQVELRYRNGRLATASYPEIARAVRSLPALSLILDGEIVAFDERGVPNFELLASRIHARSPSARSRASHVRAVYMVFDLLAYGSYDLSRLTLSERKELLFEIVRGRGLVRALGHIEKTGKELFELCEAQGVEGVVAKRADSRYLPGPTRTTEWVKIKCERDGSFVVVGWEEGQGARKRLGSLWLAAYQGGELALCGKVGSGLREQVIDDLLSSLTALKIDQCVASGELSRGPGAVFFVEPSLVVEVRYVGFSSSGALLHPTFKGIREDLAPRDCRHPSRLDVELPGEEAQVPSTRARLSNLDKVFWPRRGTTKGELIAYYAAVAPKLLPFLKDRPVVLVRYPDGVEGKNFYQWRVPQGTPSWVPHIQLPKSPERPGRGEKNVFLIDSLDVLLHVINLGCIPLHVLASRRGSLTCGDFFTLDFDIHLGTFRQAVELVSSFQALLESANLRGYLKTSGKTGLHVLVPVGPKIPFAVNKSLAELFGKLLVRQHPDIATVERRVEQRGAKVYVDTIQTGRARTIVAPYSVRAVPRATVSTPLEWAELHAALDPARFTMEHVAERAAAMPCPMATLFAQKPDVGASLQTLQEKLEL